MPHIKHNTVSGVQLIRQSCPCRSVQLFWQCFNDTDLLVNWTIIYIHLNLLKRPTVLSKNLCYKTNNFLDPSVEHFIYNLIEMNEMTISLKIPYFCSPFLLKTVYDILVIFFLIHQDFVNISHLIVKCLFILKIFIFCFHSSWSLIVAHLINCYI